MTKNPKVTVLMVTWNRAGLISRSIESVRSQTFKDWELIAVIDGSTDNTEEVLRGWLKKDKRVRYMKLPHIGRIAVVSNVGLKKAKGEYVAILDDDDWWTDDRKLEKQVKFLDSYPDYVGCGGGFLVVDKDGREQSRILKPETDVEIRKVALSANPMANSTTMFRRDAARRVGDYDEIMRQFADWDFWLKIGLQGKLYNSPEGFTAYRMWHEGSSFVNQKDNADSAARIVKRYKNDYPGFGKAIVLARLYQIYSRFPAFVRRALTPPLSLLKKTVFSR